MASSYFSPLTRRRLRAFKSHRVGFHSLWIFMALFLITLCAEFIANERPLIVYYEGSFYFPVVTDYSESDFGGVLPITADFSDPEFQENVRANGWILPAPVSFSFDTVDKYLGKPFPAAPSWRHPFGTDNQGRDIFARALYGYRVSVLFGLWLSISASIIGIILGAMQGYFGGKFDLIFQRVTEIWSGLPQLFILIILSAIFVPGFWTLFLILLAFSWTSLTGVVRAEFLRARKLGYVEAAKALGVPTYKVIVVHILPNAMIAAVTYLPFILCSSIVSLTSLDFLGFGMPPGSPSLGELLSQGKNSLHAPWLGVTAFFVLAVPLTLLVFVGEAVRDAFDPRLGG